jgi:hypothetical protein
VQKPGLLWHLPANSVLLARHFQLLAGEALDCSEECGRQVENQEKNIERLRTDSNGIVLSVRVMQQLLDQLHRQN